MGAYLISEQRGGGACQKISRRCSTEEFIGLIERGDYQKIGALKGEAYWSGGLLERGFNRAFTVNILVIYLTSWLKLRSNEFMAPWIIK